MATNAERLAEAESARHDLLTGKKIARVTTADGESVDYAPADAGKLDAYIAELRALVANQSSQRRSRSVRVFYG